MKYKSKTRDAKTLVVKLIVDTNDVTATPTSHRVEEVKEKDET